MLTSMSAQEKELQVNQQGGGVRGQFEFFSTTIQVTGSTSQTTQRAVISWVRDVQPTAVIRPLKYFVSIRSFLGGQYFLWMILCRYLLNLSFEDGSSNCEQGSDCPDPNNTCEACKESCNGEKRTNPCNAVL